MGRQIWKPGTLVYPLPSVLVTCSDGTNENIFTVAWTGTICSDPAMTYISVRKERFSYDIIKRSGRFCINLTTEDLAYATDYCGVKSGRNENKFEKLNLKVTRSEKFNIPILKKSPVVIECEVVEIKELGSHHMFIAEVLSIDADDKYINEKGAFDISKCNLIAYANGNYYTLGKKLGKFGFSVQKNKNKGKHRNNKL